jgi:signal transduction histidine kinase
LLTNACKYTPTQEKIVVTARAAQARIEVSVNNTGVEIPASERERIFEKFYRIPSTDPWKQGGTGLGLALVQKRVALLGGTIQLESSANQTCFTVSLPLKPSEL